jgi:multisubunit Na+/H+ antiporter MnhB subunit
MRAPVSSHDSPTLNTIRRALLAVLAAAIAGMMVDLSLVGHFEDINQLIPLVIGGITLLALAWVAIRPGRVSLRAMQFMMLWFIGAGILGITLHFQANAEFQRDIDPSIATVDLVWKVVQATAPPALAPAVMMQLGVLGLVYTYRHPALRDEELSAAGNTDESRNAGVSRNGRYRS